MHGVYTASPSSSTAKHRSSPSSAPRSADRAGSRRSNASRPGPALQGNNSYRNVGLTEDHDDADDAGDGDDGDGDDESYAVDDDDDDADDTELMIDEEDTPWKLQSYEESRCFLKTSAR